MSNHNKFDEFEDDKYVQRKKKMKTLRDDNRYGSIFEKSNRNKLKNIDPSMFDDEDEDDYDEYEDNFR